MGDDESIIKNFTGLIRCSTPESKRTVSTRCGGCTCFFQLDDGAGNRRALKINNLAGE
jgi:hypothetical protein